MSDRFTSRHADTLNGGEDGDNSSLERDIHEPELEPQLGADEKDGTEYNDDREDLLNISLVVERFRANTRTRLREESQKHYARTFERLAECSEFHKMTRRTLAGPRGRTLILEFVQTIPRPSWRCTVAELKAVWTHGMNLPWPIDSKRDLGRMPPTRRRETPADDVVKAWADAMVREKDVPTKLEWLLIAQLGLRPSHVCKLKWRNLRFDTAGKAFAIVADGAQEGFKTNSPVAARLPPDVIDCIETWRKAHPAPHSENPIVPWRDAFHTDPSREQNPRIMRERFQRHSRKWGLPALRPVDMRHWVASACRKSGLSKVASAHMMGHDPSQSGTMRDWYDRPQLEDIFCEQGDCLPNGPLGLLRPPELELVEGLPVEAAQLIVEFLNGTIGAFDLASRAEKLRRSISQESEMDRLRV